MVAANDFADKVGVNLRIVADVKKVSLPSFIPKLDLKQLESVGEENQEVVKQSLTDQVESGIQELKVYEEHLMNTIRSFQSRSIDNSERHSTLQSVLLSPVLKRFSN